MRKRKGKKPANQGKEGQQQAPIMIMMAAGQGDRQRASLLYRLLYPWRQR